MVDTQPLPSWNDSAAKSTILDFVAHVIKQGEADFVPLAERIATFDTTVLFGASNRCKCSSFSCSIG
jgi:hypothetical protein